MLKSLQNPTPLSLSSVIRWDRLYSKKNGEKREKREKLLRIRSERKQLYGGIIRDNIPGKNVTDTETNDKNKSSKKQTNVGIDATVSSGDVRNVTSQYASEYHWLVESQSSSKNVKIFKSRRNNEKKDEPSDKNSEPPSNSSDKGIKSPPSDSKTNSSQSTYEFRANDDTPTNQMSMINPKSAIISAKNLLQQFMYKKRNNEPQQIPFDETTLKAMINYPLVCQKSSKSQVDELNVNTSLRLPSISKVLQGTMPESARIALRKWKLLKIAELGLDGFKQYEQDTFNRGKDFHSAIENFLNSGTVPERDSSIINLWDSIDSSLNSLKPKSVLSEQPLLHADLKYQGIIDNVSIVNDELTAFEWKTSEKIKPRLTSTYDAPVQLCAYLGALNADPRYDLTVKNGYVIVAYTNGDAANVFNLTESDLRKYWLIWLQRLQEYYIRVRDGTLPDPI